MNENTEPKFKKLSNRFAFLQLSLPALCVYICFIPALGVIKWLIVLILIEYFISTISLSYIRIYDDYIEFIYPTKLWNKRRIIWFKDLDYVIYHGTPPRSLPIIGFYTKNKRFKILSSSNSFTCKSFELRKEILRFLDLKGLEIELNGTEKDEAILDD